MKRTCNKSILRPAAEPVHGAAGYKCWKLQRPVSELLSNRREAQHNMQILSDPGHEIIVQVFIGWQSLGKLFLHFREELGEDLVDLLSGKQVGHLKTETRVHLSARNNGCTTSLNFFQMYADVAFNIGGRFKYLYLFNIDLPVKSKYCNPF